MHMHTYLYTCVVFSLSLTHPHTHTHTHIQIGDSYMIQYENGTAKTLGEAIVFDGDGTNPFLTTLTRDFEYDQDFEAEGV